MSFEFDYDYSHEMTEEEFYDLLKTAPLGFFKNYQMNHLIKILHKNGHLTEQEARELIAMK